jgi:multisubunit Na+/H+ antiporter MnhG subunit
MFEISYTLGYNAAGVGIGTLLLAVAAVALRTQAIMPRWLALVLLAAGVVFVTPLSRFLLGPALLLLAVVSVRLCTAPARPEA